MKTVSRIVAVSALGALVAVTAARAQQRGTFPWRAGDAPPTVAGLSLGASRARIDSVLGGPESIRTTSPGVQVLGYRTRGVALMYTDADSLAVVYLVARKAGQIGGTRVGDERDSVVARWGEPSGVEENISIYQVGRWAVIVRLDSARARVEMLALARVTEDSGAEAEGPYDATANPRRDIDAALQLSRGDRKLVLLDFGANWCLDCIVLDRLYQDSTVAPYLAANFRVVRVDVGRFDRNLDISRAYGNPIEGGVPAVVVLSPTGDVVATTKDGSLESARSATPAQVLRFLQSWVAAARR